ncbi:uroporphyrinogen-III C-methyltransferase [Georgenia satyanarayanai]|uniref:Uroporphyrinogen-III C-methyltransferase n=1 Tax=Georgenia satyanarayanai TaxID=860221 RepID=A0A2Y9AAX9_9MICO|nr:uroporphyrinogen-III C-methyltransferase [Georgenia satyanarayanai]PYF99775.1 uroporphyrinogen-III C-methyltransferase [Georgenia satyanarayanai]SSA41754.1 uroporphyrinogen-III C-methyltransferase [Georgenia satyanarayanai]
MTTLLGLELTGRTVLVAGGGRAAARRVRAMLDDGALIRVVAPGLCADLRLLVDDPASARALTWLAREVRESDLDGVWLALAATDDPAVDRAVARWAEERRTWCVDAGAVHDRTARTPESTSSAGRRRRRRASGGVGSVVLVGGGPGAVDLLTVRGRRALAEADVVVTDRLGPVDVLDELAPGVEVVDVGKTPGHHPVPQEEINAILVAQARRGRRVVRLKGGDPFVYGRGGEEVAACHAAGIPVEVVPGVSSALSVPALAGIPLTHRGTVAAFHVTSGHDALDEAALVSARDRTATLVILMGVSQLPRLMTQLLTAGADPGLPVALVENGSTPRQRVTRAVLGDVVRRAAEVGVRSPAVIVVGDVAAEGRLAQVLVA